MLLALVIFPRVGLQRTGDANHLALLQILRHVRETITERHAVEPLRLFILAEAGRSCHAERHDRLAVLGILHLAVFSEVADGDHHIHTFFRAHSGLLSGVE